MGRVASEGRPKRARRAAALAAVGCACLAAALVPGRRAAGDEGQDQRTTNAEVMIITRGALEGGLSPSG